MLHVFKGLQLIKCRLLLRNAASRSLIPRCKLPLHTVLVRARVSWKGEIYLICSCVVEGSALGPRGPQYQLVNSADLSAASQHSVLQVCTVLDMAVQFSARAVCTFLSFYLATILQEDGAQSLVTSITVLERDQLETQAQAGFGNSIRSSLAMSQVLKHKPATPALG